MSGGQSDGTAGPVLKRVAKRALATALEAVGRLRGGEMIAIRVLSVTDLSPHMRRVAFSATGLARFADPANLHVRLSLPPDGAARGGWLKVATDGSAHPAEGQPAPVQRKYTLRAVDPAAGSLVIDFVLHGDAGPGSAWAIRAQPGDMLGMTGPGGRTCGPADWYLFAGDETALPAIARMLEHLPASARGIALIEIAGGRDEQELRRPAGLQLRWLHRGGAPAGTTALLQDAVADLRPPEDGSRIFAWAAAEFDAIEVIRRDLRARWKLDKHRHLAVAYWRRTPDGADSREPGHAS